MSNMRTLLRGAATAAIVLILGFAACASAGDILDDWAKVQPPPPPALKPVQLDGATTAFLILDMEPGQCDHNPRCAATVPKIKQLHDAARKAGAMFWYSVPGRDAKPEEIYSGFRPAGDAEWEPINGPDKFRNGSKLEDKLKARGIKTAIICGHSFQGVGIGTGTGLALRGYQVIIPIDCMASEEMFQEQYAAYHLGKAANGVAPRVTLTRTTMIKF
jgi:nicotinamidase-related amidase